MWIQLEGSWSRSRECASPGDWKILYLILARTPDSPALLLLCRTGTFGKQSKMPKPGEKRPIVGNSHATIAALPRDLQIWHCKRLPCTGARTLGLIAIHTAYDQTEIMPFVYCMSSSCLGLQFYAVSTESSLLSLLYSELPCNYISKPWPCFHRAFTTIGCISDFLVYISVLHHMDWNICFIWSTTDPRYR